MRACLSIACQAVLVTTAHRERHGRPAVRNLYGYAGGGRPPATGHPSSALSLSSRGGCGRPSFRTGPTSAPMMTPTAIAAIKRRISTAWWVLVCRARTVRTVARPGRRRERLVRASHGGGHGPRPTSRSSIPERVLPSESIMLLSQTRSSMVPSMIAPSAMLTSIGSTGRNSPSSPPRWMGGTGISMWLLRARRMARLREAGARMSSTVMV